MSVVLESVILVFALIVVSDPCVPDIQFGRLIAVDQTVPYYCIPHLSASSSQHLQNTEKHCDQDWKMCIHVKSCSALH